MTIEIPEAPAQASEVPGAIVRLVERVQPSVVQVRSEGRGIGAGVIWSADGQIITNHHVVSGERAQKITVLLENGQEYNAQLIASNQTLDLALLKVPGQDLPAIPLGDTSRLRVGELVFAVGHPWGVRGVVTAGIISGLGEVSVPGSRSGRKAQYIRSDVRLRPGNSGGPLLNAEGAVIGINAMVFGGDLGISIPGHVVAEWLSSVQNGPKAYLGAGVRPVRLRIQWPGERQAQEVTGLRVETLNRQGPAAASGLQEGDTLLEIGGERVRGTESLTNLLSTAAPGMTLDAQVLRGDTILALSLKLGQRS